MGISVPTRKALWGRARDECAFPSCLQKLTSDVRTPERGGVQTSIIGQEAHIRAQSAGGPRYDPDYEDVDGYENLMLLCPTHHTMIDAFNGDGYTVKDLVSMKANHEQNQARREELRATLQAYLGDRYEAENTVQFQQAELRGPTVDSMFVDVPIGYRRDTSPFSEFLSRVVGESPNEQNVAAGAPETMIAGATQILLHPDWKGHAVLVGGPGQGKSTVLQYVCQFHRSRRLSRSGYTLRDHNLTQATTVYRFPIRIDLRKYAQWVNSNGGAPKTRKKHSTKPATISWRSLEEYIIDHIEKHIGANTFGPRDLVLLLATEPTLIALDGLDEVASLTTRARVVEEIAQMRGRLGADAADLVILVATRPGTSLQPLTSSRAFPVLHLQRLTQGLRLQYLRQWVGVSHLSSEASAKLEATFMDHQHVPHINELASYPMQLAILLHLLHRRQLLPQQRTELYAEYLKTFLDREQTEDKEPLLADQRRVVENTHAYLGWYLQTKAEEGQSSGSIERDDLRRLLREHLAGQPEEQKLAEEIYSAITDRVLCLVERDNAFEFEVQSLREYFAARYLFENLTPRGNGNSRDDGLNALLERPYWANVCRFFIGMLAIGEIRALVDNIRTVRTRTSPRPVARSTAVTLLNDRIYDGFGDADVQNIVDLILEGPGLIFSEDGALDAANNPLELGERAGRAQAVAHLKERLVVEDNSEVREAAVNRLVAHSSLTDDLPAWWWSHYAPTSAWLITAARLRAFARLAPHESESLRTALLTTDSPDVWRAELLSLGNYDGQGDQILQIVLDELNEGAAEVIAPNDGHLDLGIVISYASSIISSPSQRSIWTGPISESKQRSAIVMRIRRTMSLGDRALDLLNPADWGAILGAIADTWGDGWLLRRAMSRVPEGMSLPTLGGGPGSESLGRESRLRSEFRLFRADEDWWRERLLSISPPRDQMLNVIALLQHAKAAVVARLTPELERIVHGLEPKQFRVLEGALHRDVVSRQGRALDLQEDFRMNRLNLSGRVLWLLWIVGTDATRERIPKFLGPVVGDALLAGCADGLRVVAAAQTRKKLKVEQFRHVRNQLPPEGWAAGANISTISNSMAKEMLLEPENWPAELVQSASDRLAAQAASRTVSLAEFATKSRWF